VTGIDKIITHFILQKMDILKKTIAGVFKSSISESSSEIG